MKLKNNPLKKRLILSLVVAFSFVLAIGSSFYFIKYGPVINDTPVVLRHSFEWNQKVWSKISNNGQLSVKKPRPPKGKNPRVNGDIGLLSAVELKNYKMEVISGDKHLKLPLSALHATPTAEYATDFRCIEGWSEEMQYAGARFSDFMNFYGVGKKSDGTFYNYVGLETPDGEYYVSIDMESMLHPQTVLAYEMNQMPLLVPNGAPVRLMIPVKYGIKNLKRIGRIIFSDVKPHDYWEERGYDWYAGL